MIFEVAGFGKNFIIFAEASSNERGLFWAKDVNVIPNIKISIVINFFSKVKVVNYFKKSIKQTWNGICNYLLDAWREC